MLLGFNLLLWTTHVTEEHFPLFAELKRAGYDGVEIPVFEGDPAHFARVGRIVRDEGLRCTAVTVLPDEAHSAVSADPVSRRGAMKRLHWAVDCLHARAARSCPARSTSRWACSRAIRRPEEEHRRLAEVHTTAADYAAGLGVKLSIEPLNRFECYVLNTVAQSAELVARVGRPNYGLLYDTFHANIEEKDPVGVIAPNLARSTTSTSPRTTAARRARGTRRSWRRCASSSAAVTRAGSRSRRSGGRCRTGGGDQGVAGLLPVAGGGLPVGARLPAGDVGEGVSGGRHPHPGPLPHRGRGPG
jgi:D-psicose/D-tagatose/L-ribulose 3-epimerase